MKEEEENKMDADTALNIVSVFQVQQKQNQVNTLQ